MISVLVVEDEITTAEALAAYVERVPGFTVAGLARTGADALHRLAAGGVDLVLLDIYLPDLHGLDVLRRLRASGDPVDVVVVTRARDLGVLRAAVSFGVAHYLLKPFTFTSVRQRLEQFQSYRLKLSEQGSALAQEDIDQILHRLRDTPDVGTLPKGISPESLHAVLAAMKTAGEAGMSAVEVAHALGSSRVTARRYLEYLADTGLVARSARYGGVGRPEVEYRLLPSGEHGAAAPDPR